MKLEGPAKGQQPAWQANARKLQQNYRVQQAEQRREIDRSHVQRKRHRARAFQFHRGAGGDGFGVDDRAVLDQVEGQHAQQNARRMDQKCQPSSGSDLAPLEGFDPTQLEATYQRLTKRRSQPELDGYVLK